MDENLRREFTELIQENWTAREAAAAMRQMYAEAQAWLADRRDSRRFYNQDEDQS
jgi:hypothetical protein